MVMCVTSIKLIICSHCGRVYDKDTAIYERNDDTAIYERKIDGAIKFICECGYSDYNFINMLVSLHEIKGLEYVHSNEKEFKIND